MSPTSAKGKDDIPAGIEAQGGGPLAGIRIIEFAGLGPAPFAAMLLADMGADVIRIDRPESAVPDRADFVGRGRRNLLLDLKDATGREGALALVERADALIEGFRPGVMERLGLGPDSARRVNPKLVYGRMTGWGQTGPLAQAAGHDINYIALAGALGAIGPAGGNPVPPLNLVGDYGGGALYLALGVLAALLEAGRSGRGQVIDCAMCDGVASLMSFFHVLKSQGQWSDQRASNLLDGGAPFYAVYECADGQHVSIGALEPKFYALLCKLMDLDMGDLPDRNDQANWPILHEHFQKLFLTRKRSAWCELLEGTDACFAPVLSLTEAPHHPHLSARSTFVDFDGINQPAPAPRFERTPSAVRGASVIALDEALRLWTPASHRNGSR